MDLAVVIGGRRNICRLEELAQRFDKRVFQLISEKKIGEYRAAEALRLRSARNFFSYLSLTLRRCIYFDLLCLAGPYITFSSSCWHAKDDDDERSPMKAHFLDCIHFSWNQRPNVTLLPFSFCCPSVGREEGTKNKFRLILARLRPSFSAKWAPPDFFSITFLAAIVSRFLAARINQSSQLADGVFCRHQLYLQIKLCTCMLHIQ